MLKAKNITFQHVKCNRIADFSVKQKALEDAAIDINDKEWLLASIAGRQKWPVNLNRRLGEDVEWSKAQDSESTSQEHVVDLKQKFPRWLWNANPGHYTIRGAPLNVSPPKLWKWSDNCWQQVQRFASSLKWGTKEENEVAFVELTYLFHKRGFRCQ